MQCALDINRYFRTRVEFARRKGGREKGAVGERKVGRETCQKSQRVKSYPEDTTRETHAAPLSARSVRSVCRCLSSSLLLLLPFQIANYR